MLLSLLTIACSSPTVSLTSAEHEGLPMVSGLDDSARDKLEKAMLNCYSDALASDSALSGTVRVMLQGSHGILKVESPDQGPLASCARTPFEDSRMQRVLGDGDLTMGALFTITFTP